MNSPKDQLLALAIGAIATVGDRINRAELLIAAADLVDDERVRIDCLAVAACIREAEKAQLSLFQKVESARPETLRA